MNTPRHTLEDNPTIFGKILRKEIPANIIYEDDDVLAFHDIAPQAPVHIVIIPKAHISGLHTTTPEDAAVLGKLMATVNTIATKAGVVESGYRLISNAGANGGQEVPHLHFHLLGGKKLGPKIVG